MSTSGHTLGVRSRDARGEQDADSRADQALRGPESSSHGREPSYADIPRGREQPLPAAVRSFFEPRFAHDFSKVRVYSDAQSARLAGGLGAAALTYGTDIYFGAGQPALGTAAGTRLLAHELAHVTQQAEQGRPTVQRRLLLTGDPTNIHAFIAMSEAASGLQLFRDPVTHQVTAIGSRVTPATSQTFADQLTRIMDAPAQNAEIHAGADQPNVDIGAFPAQRDLTAGGVQLVDMDDIAAMEAGAPGIGVADLLHEIVENFEAHSHAPVAGVDRFPVAHEAGLQAEAGVARDIVGSGNRVAEASQDTGPNVSRVAEDYDTYYVLSTLTADPAKGTFVRSNARFAAKVNVGPPLMADHFASGSDATPAAAPLIVAAVAMLLALNPLATVQIEGFTDNVGTAADNVDLGARRAENGAADLVAAGVDGGRIHTVGRGAVNFVAPNVSEADRARNRRILFTVTRPGP